MTTSERGLRARARVLWPELGLALALVAALMVTLVAGGPLQARPLQALNSRVVLDLPDGYVPSRSFAGFQNEAQGVSYVIQELPAAAFDELVEGFTPEKLATRAIQDAEVATLARPGKHV